MSMVIDTSTLRGSEVYRHFRGITLPDSLSDLKSEHTGVVPLPHDLAWSGQKEFNLDDSYEEKHLYERVITEARNPGQLNEFLNEQNLKRLWHTIYLSPFIREAWEKKFPTLKASKEDRSVGV